MKKGILFFILIIGLSRVIAQVSDDQPVIRKFGLGLRIEQYEIGGINSSNIMSKPIDKITFSFSALNNFRIEPELGFRLKKQESDIVYQFVIGSGFFLMHRFSRINFYGGIRFGIGFGNYFLYENYYNQTRNYKITQARKSIAPTLGLEYLFYKHFSIGGELSIKHTSTESSSIYSDVVVPDEKQNTYLTGITLRYYF
jgi:hypothetical protein